MLKSHFYWSNINYSLNNNWIHKSIELGLSNMALDTLLTSVKLSLKPCRSKKIYFSEHVSIIILDLAVMRLSFGANIGIHNTVQYKDMMKDCDLDPNSGILTSITTNTCFEIIFFTSHWFNGSMKIYIIRV